MHKLLLLIENETLKMWKKRRFLVIVLVLLVIIPMFTYAQLTVAQNNKDKFADWRNEVLQQITDMQNRLSSNRIPEEWKKQQRIAVQQLQYYLDHDVNPSSPNGVTFTREFMNNAVGLFIPLLVLTIGSDLVSGERGTGTIKMLLTKPVRRWKVLFSKLAALTLYVSLLVGVMVLLCYLISGMFFGYGGWGLPIFTGFTINGSEVDTSFVHVVPQWLYMLMQTGLVWLSAMTVAILALMVSVLVRSTAASMVIMMASVIAGTILSSMSSSWENAKYLFAVNLNLPAYLEGSPPPIEGMSFSFSLIVLAIWAIAGLIVSFSVFTKQDILN
ncbi:ABC-2 type transport system permease protein [Paenibacillus algorifonticola]|uniref:ABC-2 type transport system permease protein n=1 Tax=Paenibacillus algorifonticola TaxID=684063 RepID=A0A1I2C621_9BACL|nr:ABC transporter permease [Paenibacillus algorifonticola]SFE63786.1 ABC-2 type transport system permease protein [Paenibacillus algorifonticola]